MPESRTTILLSVIGLALSALGVWLAYSENQRKANEARPVLDITEPQVFRQSIGGRYEIKFTIHNRGKVEASNIEVHADNASVTLANSLPDTKQSTSFSVAELDKRSNEPIFRGLLLYANRLTGQTYNEAWCYQASIPIPRFYNSVLRLGSPSLQPITLKPCKGD